MTCAATIRMRQRDPLTERILQIASRKGMFQTDVARLAGMPPSRFYDRANGKSAWTHDELHDVATALNERIEFVLDVTRTL